MRRCLLLPLVLAAALVAQAVPPVDAAGAIPAWTTYRHDAGRSGVDPDSTSPLTPAPAWQTPSLDGELYAQPLVFGSYVYVATENDSVYKLDAATGAVVWSRHLATPEPSSMAPCGDIAPSIGVTGTPVIDPVANRIYLVGAVLTAGAVHHELFAVDLISGKPIAGFPIVVDPPFPAGGAPVNQLQRPGLALDRGRILIGYGGNGGDCNTYWGWVVSAPVDGTTGLSSFQVDSGKGHTKGAIWASGNAPTVDAAGDAFVATGNGSGNFSSNPEYGESVVKLNPSAVPLDFWAPTNWQALDSTDGDLGSSMPTLLPGGFVFESGKDGNGYLLNGGHLGNVSAPVQDVSGFCSAGSFGGSVYDAANATLYVACGGGLRALSLSPGSPPSLGSKPGFSAPSQASGPPVIAAGLVWVIHHSTAGNPGTLYGLDPTSGTARSQFSIPENGSQINHFAIPSAGGGRLFVASGDQVTAFTIARPPTASATTTSLTSSASRIHTGEVVSLTAAIAPGPDSGTVTFTDGATPISGCSKIAVSLATSGRAVCRTAFAHAGRHNLTASYSGDPFYAASTSAVLGETVDGSGGGPQLRIISHASISPRRFTAKHGATLRVTLSEDVTLTVAITRMRHGRVVGHRCSATRHTGRSCRLRVTVKRLRFHLGPGRKARKLSLRHLRPGHYTALVRATDHTGRRSRTIRIPFTIIRPRQ